MTATRTTDETTRRRSTGTPTKTYANSSNNGRRYSLLEDKRNQHRDKAHVLLKLAEAVDDSNQRRRKATAKAGRATVQDLRKLRDGLEQFQEQKGHSSGDYHKNKNGVNATCDISQDSIISDDTASASTIQSTVRTVQAVVTAVYQLREHSHLQYQMLEMKYFDIKRHAFDVEHQNRKLQLQLLETNNNNNNNATNNIENDEATSASISPEQGQTSSNKGLVDQLQQENCELRQQLRESCMDSRKLVQENYGLRKILLDAGVNFTALMKNSNDDDAESNKQEQQSPGEDEKQDDDSNGSESDDEEDGFEDAQEFSMDTVTEETDTDLLMEENGFHIGATGLGSRQSQINGEKKSSATAEINPSMPTPEMLRSKSSMNDSTSSIQTATAAGSSGSKRGSRRSVTFAAMANKLQTQRSLESSDTDDDRDNDNFTIDDEESFVTAQTSTNYASSTTRTKEEKDHDQNLALLGVGGVYTASTARSTPANTRSNESEKEESGGSKDSRRYSNILMMTGGSGSNDNNSQSSRKSQKQGTPQKLRRRSHGDILRGRSRSSSSSSLRPTSHAISAKDLMKKSKKSGRSSSSSSRNRNNYSGTFNIRMSGVTPPRSTHQNVKVSKPIDPLEEERRLSALLGGFSPGATPLTSSASGSSTPTAAANTASTHSTTSAAGIQRYPDYYNDDAVSVSSVNSKGFFRRRSRKAHDDDDNVSVSSALSMGSLFSFKKKKKKKSSSSSSSVSSPRRGSTRRNKNGGDDSRSVG